VRIPHARGSQRDRRAPGCVARAASAASDRAVDAGWVRRALRRPPQRQR
jgi:hypothetical protein